MVVRGSESKRVELENIFNPHSTYWFWLRHLPYRMTSSTCVLQNGFKSRFRSALVLRTGTLRLETGTTDYRVRVSWSRRGYDYKTNHRKPSQTTANHHKPTQTTTNYRKPPQTIANYLKPPQTTTRIWAVKTKKSRQTTTDHRKPPPEYE